MRGAEPHPNGTVHITVGTGGAPLWRSRDVRGSFVEEPRRGSVFRVGDKHGHLSVQVMSNGTLLAQFHEMAASGTDDPCTWHGDGNCDVPTYCSSGDYADCGTDPPPTRASTRQASAAAMSSRS